MSREKLSAFPHLDNMNDLSLSQKGSSFRAWVEILFWKFLVRLLSRKSPKDSAIPLSINVSERDQNWISLSLFMAVIGLISGILLGFLLYY